MTDSLREKIIVALHDHSSSYGEDADKILAVIAPEMERLQDERDVADNEELRATNEIIARIWKILGDPTYEELKGRSIYDLIRELQAKLDTAVKALRLIYGHEYIVDAIDTARDALAKIDTDTKGT